MGVALSSPEMGKQEVVLDIGVQESLRRYPLIRFSNMDCNMLKTKLNLRCGDVVQVRSQEEILATLDDRGCLEHLPFMPEMLRYCGQQFRVYKRADKTCDTITGSGGRRMTDAVHLDDLRCDGSAHGGCQAGCLLFWKEAWLRRIHEPDNDVDAGALKGSPGEEALQLHIRSTDIEGRLARGVYQTVDDARLTNPKYACQATKLLKATSPLPWWDIRQYVRDVRSRNVSLGQLSRILGLAIVHAIIQTGVGFRFLTALYDRVSRLCGGAPYPFRAGSIPASSATPTARMNLLPGDVVRVQSYSNILKTLNTRNQNRGLRFDAEMASFCGKTYRVQRSVHQIINESTGEMMQFHHPCIVLEGVFCRSQYSRGRLCCPRSIPSYWREIWLERTDASI